jgi:hypothetical protein
MKRIDLNFSHQMTRHRHRRDLLIVIVSLVLLMFLISEYMANTRQLAQQNLEQQPVVEQFDSPVISERDLRRQQLAHALAASLNTPWYQMLDAIEIVKQQHPDVYLKSILPDTNKEEILITGQVEQLDMLLSFIDGLNKQTLFDDVLPLNQRQLVSGGKGIEFSLKMGWHSHE